MRAKVFWVGLACTIRDIQSITLSQYGRNTVCAGRIGELKLERKQEFVNCVTDFRLYSKAA